MVEQGLKVQTRTEQLLYRLYPRLTNFPQSEKFGLAARIKEALHLELHPEKSTIFPLRQGVNTIGFKMHPTHRLLRDDCKRKIKRKLRAMPSLIEQGRMTPKKAEQIVGSWGGHARYGCSRNFIARLVERHSFLHIKSGALRFDERGPCYV